MALTAYVEADGERLILGTLEEQAQLFYDVSGNQTILQTDDSSGILVDRLTISNAGLFTFATGITITTGDLTVTAGALVITAGDVTIGNGYGLVVGSTTQLTGGAVSEFQVLGTALADGSIILGLFAASALAPDFQFIKGRGTTIGSLTIVQDNDEVGRLVWLPADGADLATEAAVFQAEVDDASPAAGDIGMAFVWESMAGGGAAIAERMRVSAAGDLLIANGGGLIVGHTAQITGNALAEVQILGSALADSSVIVGVFSADAVGPEFTFVKSRHATVGSNTIVQDNDIIGKVVWLPADGTDFATEAAVFQAEVDDATPAAGDIGMAFVWRAMPGAAGAIADVLRLSAAGALTPGVTNAGALGTTALMWSDLFLASGAVINFDNGDVTLTHGANILALDGGNLRINGLISQSVAPATDKALYSEYSFGDVTADMWGIRFIPLIAPTTAAYTGTFIGIEGRPQVTNASSQAVTAIVGVQAYVDVQGFQAAKAVTSAYGFRSAPIIGGGAQGANVTVTSYYGYYANNPTVTAGAITNNYAIYIADQTSGGTLDYGIYIVGADTAAILVASADPIRLGLAGTGTGKMELVGTTSGVVTLTVAAAATGGGANWTLTLPITAGEAGDVLVTDGAGVSSWVSGMRSVDVQLTNAQVLAVRATPITLVAAPGANRAIIVHKVYLVCDAAAGAYTESADNLVIEYADGVDITAAIETTGFIDGAAVRVRTYGVLDTELTPPANSAVRIINTGDGEFGGGNASNTLSVRVWYSVVDTVAFS